MTSNNDYKTPKDRISDSFRDKLYAEESDTFPVGSFHGTNDQPKMQLRQMGAPGCRCTVPERNQGQKRSDASERRNVSKNAHLAMVYSPFHTFEERFAEEEALHKGSLFSDLYFPFEAYCCGRKEYEKKGGWKL